jgi:hypothetical protein
MTEAAELRLIRDVIERLAPIPRLPASAGERQAAVLVRQGLSALGCRVSLEPVPAYHSYAWPVGLMSALGAAGALLGWRGQRVWGGLAGAVAAGGIADDITGRWTACRRLTMRPRTAWNVVAETGDPGARRTLCVLAHHDAAPSGVVFDQRAHRWLARRHPELIARLRSNPPLWWPVLAGPVLAGVGSATRTRVALAVGLGLCLGTVAAMADIGHRPAVPGANDNLSGVATLHALAARLRDRPVRGLRVLLVSAGAEEALQEGIRGFARAHFGGLPRDRTWFVTVDTVGSGNLVLLEGEGPVRMHDYDAGFKSVVRACAERIGVDLAAGLRSRSSTDGIVPSRAGYPTATVVSVDRHRLMPHYHLDSDLPEHLDYPGIAAAVRLVEAVARHLAGGGRITGAPHG